MLLEALEQRMILVTNMNQRKEKKNYHHAAAAFVYVKTMLLKDILAAAVAQLNVESWLLDVLPFYWLSTTSPGTSS